MADEATSKSKVLSVTTLWSDEEIPEPDNLGGDMSKAYVVKMWTGSFKRGLLIIPGPEGYFIPATKSGVMDATEFGILSEEVGPEIDVKEIEEGNFDEYTTAIAFFGGEINGAGIILPYETEEDNHEELLAELADKFRKQGLNVR